MLILLFNQASTYSKTGTDTATASDGVVSRVVRASRAITDSAPCTQNGTATRTAVLSRKNLDRAFVSLTGPTDNPDFQSSDISRWTSTAGATHNYEPTFGYNSPGSLHLVQAAPYTGNDNDTTPGFSGLLVPGRQYRITSYAYVPSLNTTRDDTAMYVQTGVGDFWTHFNAGQVGQWVEHSVVFPAAFNIINLFMCVRGEVYWDAISIREEDRASATKVLRRDGWDLGGPVGTNYHPNPGNEGDSWPGLTASGGGSIAATTVEAHTGTRSLLANSNGTTNSDAGWYQFPANADGSVHYFPAGSTALLSAWVKAPVGALLKIQAQIFSGGWGLIQNSVPFTGTGDWQYVSTTATYAAADFSPVLEIYTAATGQPPFYTDDSYIGTLALADVAVADVQHILLALPYGEGAFTPPRVGRALVIDNYNGGSAIATNALRTLGYTVVVNTAASTLADVAGYDLLVTDDYAWSSGAGNANANSLLIAAYAAGYRILTTGNDSYAGSPPQITATVTKGDASQFYNAYPTGAHYVSQGWPAYPTLESDTGRIPTALRSTAVAVATMTQTPVGGISAFVEEDPGGSGGRWFHLQPSGAVAATNALFQRGTDWLFGGRYSDSATAVVTPLNQSYTRTGTDSVTAADALARTARLTRVAPAQVLPTLIETATRGQLGAIRTQADTAHGTDALARLVRLFKAPSELLITPFEVLSSVGKHLRNMAENPTQAVTDNFGRSGGLFHRNNGELAGAADTQLIPGQTLSRTDNVEDIPTVEDLVSPSTHYRTNFLGDSAPAADAAKAYGGNARFASEFVGGRTDLATGTRTTFGSATLTRAITASFAPRGSGAIVWHRSGVESAPVTSDAATRPPFVRVRTGVENIPLQGETNVKPQIHNFVLSGDEEILFRGDVLNAQYKLKRTGADAIPLGSDQTSWHSVKVGSTTLSQPTSATFTQPRVSQQSRSPIEDLRSQFAETLFRTLRPRRSNTEYAARSTTARSTGTLVGRPVQTVFSRVLFLGISDTTTFAKANGRSGIETLPVPADVMTQRRMVGTRVVNDFVTGLVDNVVRNSLPRSRSGTDAAPAIDSLVAFRVKARGVSDIAGAIDGYSTHAIHLRPVAETLPTADEWNDSQRKLFRNPQEVLNQSAVLDGGSAGIVGPVLDGGSASGGFTDTVDGGNASTLFVLGGTQDVATRLVRYGRALLDVTTITDQVKVNRIGRTATDTYPTSDSATATTSHQLNRTGTDLVINGSDAVVRLVRDVRTTTDAAPITDGGSSRSDRLFRSFTETVAVVSDAATRAALALARTGFDIGLAASSDSVVRLERPTRQTVDYASPFAQGNQLLLTHATGTGLSLYGNASISVLTDATAWEGNSYTRVTSSGSFPGASTSSDHIPVVPGQMVSAHFALRTAGGRTDASCFVMFFNSSNTQIGQGAAANLTLTGAWQEVWVPPTQVPVGATYAWIFARLGGTSTAGDAFDIDGLGLFFGATTPPSWSPPVTTMESLNSWSAHFRSFTETIYQGEVLTSGARQFPRVLVDAAQGFDSPATRTINLTPRTGVDFTTTSDGPQRIFKPQRTPVEVAAATDVPTLQRVSFLTGTETISISDAATKLRRVSSTAVEVTGLSETVARFVHFVRTATDIVFGSDDSQRPNQVYFRPAGPDFAPASEFAAASFRSYPRATSDVASYSGDLAIRAAAIKNRTGSDTALGIDVGTRGLLITHRSVGDVVPVPVDISGRQWGAFLRAGFETIPTVSEGDIPPGHHAFAAPADTVTGAESILRLIKTFRVAADVVPTVFDTTAAPQYLTRLLTETLPAADAALARFYRAVRNPAEDIPTIEVLSRTGGHFTRFPLENLSGAQADTVVSGRNFGRSATDTLPVGSQTANRTSDWFGRTAFDVLIVPFDSASIQSPHNRSLLDAASALDSLTRSTRSYRYGIDTALAVDEISRSNQGMGRTASDSAHFSFETLYSNTVAIRDLIDVATSDDSLVRQLALTRAPVESLVLPGDQADRSGRFSALLIDTIFIGDVGGRALRVVRSAADVALSNAVGIAARLFRRGGAETAAVSDLLAVRRFLRRSGIDIQTLADFAYRLLDRVRYGLDVVHAVDKGSGFRSRTVNLTEVAPSADVTGRKTFKIRRGFDVLSSAYFPFDVDQITRTYRGIRTPTDSTPAVDQIRRIWKYLGTTTDFAPVSDSYLRKTAKIRYGSDGLGSGSSVARTFRGFRADGQSAPVTDVLRRDTRRGRIQIEILHLGESLASSWIRPPKPYGPPEVTITSISRQKLSFESGRNASVATFEFDRPVDAWVVRVGSSNAFDGTLLDSWSGAETYTGLGTVNSSALRSGENEISIYGRSAASGEWTRPDLAMA